MSRTSFREGYYTVTQVFVCAHTWIWGMSVSRKTAGHLLAIIFVCACECVYVCVYLCGCFAYVSLDYAQLI